jgi:hypothetical protein
MVGDDICPHCRNIGRMVIMINGPISMFCPECLLEIDYPVGWGYVPGTHKSHGSSKSKRYGKKQVKIDLTAIYGSILRDRY